MACEVLGILHLNTQNNLPAMTLQEDRIQWEEHAASQPLPQSIIETKEVISGVPCLWLHLKHRKGDETIIFYLHGGGLTSGSALTHKHFVASIVETTGESALIVDYRLVPEHAFPAPLEDALTVYRALLKKDSINAQKIIFGGDSSGAGLALSTIVKLRDEGSELPSKLFTISGVFDMTMSGESMQVDPKKEPYLTLEDLKDWQKNYFEDLDSPLLSPYFSNLSNLPPSLILVGNDELWLSDSTRIYEKLIKNGNRSKIRIWESMTHVWAMDPSLEESKEALIEIRNFIQANKAESVLIQMPIDKNSE